MGLALLLLGGLVIGGGVLIYGLLQGAADEEATADAPADTERPPPPIDAPSDVEPGDSAPDTTDPGDTVPDVTDDSPRPRGREARIPGDLDGILRWIQAHPHRTERGMRAAFLNPELSRQGG